MALLYPPEINAASVPASEQIVRNSLSKLDNQWRVFHSVKWQAVRKGRQGDGEADFILIHPEYGILIQEVKGGEVSIKDGQWVSVDVHGKEHKIKNPFDQAKDSKYALLSFLKDLSPNLTRIPINYCVVFPSIAVEAPLGTFAPAEIVIDLRDLDDMSVALGRVVSHWGMRCQITSEEMKRLAALFAPTVSFRPLLRDTVDRSQAEFQILSDRQRWVFAHLAKTRKVVVKGPAGTGKTILAVEKAKSLDASGFKTLFLCFNRLLADILKAVTKEFDNVTVESFHGFAFRELRKAKMEIPTEPDETWWTETCPDLLEKACQINATRYDALIIDEYQDFRANWLLALQLGLADTPDAPIYVFGDTHQQLYAGDFSPGKDFVEFTLSLNCRNTKQIGTKVAKIFGDSMELMAVLGPEPVFLDVANNNEALQIVESLTSRLIREERLDPQKITVLTDSTALVDEMRQRVVEDSCFCGFGQHGIAVETIHRFKGLESPVTILVLTQDNSRHSLKELAYVGFSRAKVMLVIVGPKSLRRRIFESIRAE